MRLTTDMWRSDNVGTVQADFKGVMNFSTHFGHITPWHIFALDSQVVFATIPVNAQKTSPPRHDTSLRFGRQNVAVFYEAFIGINTSDSLFLHNLIVYGQPEPEFISGTQVISFPTKEVINLALKCGEGRASRPDARRCINPFKFLEMPDIN